jgi:Do/DeqQ family serine protease
MIAATLGGIVALMGYTMIVPGQTTIIESTPSAVTVVDKLVSSGIPAGFDFKKASKRSTPAVVQIYAVESADQVRQRSMQRRQRSFFDFFGDDFFGYGSRPKNGSGSGVIMSSNGYIVTNNHVVGFADNIRVTLEDGKEYKAVKVGVDPITDLAVIKIEADGLPTIPYGDSDKIEIGEWVLAVGNPFSYLTSTVTAGIVSAKGRDLDIIEGGQSIVEFIQTDAAVNPGNSGGALVNVEGELVGINTAIATPTGVYAGYSFAIPSNLVKKIVADIIEFGDIRGGTLGIEGYDVDNYLVEEYGLKVRNGFMVINVAEGGNADKAGIKTGDVIQALNRKEVYDFEDLKSAMAVTAIGENLDILINRKGKAKTLSIALDKNN